MSGFTTRVSRGDDNRWVVRVTRPDGQELFYRYGSEREARYFAAIFDLGPTYVPAPTPPKAVDPDRRKNVWAKAAFSGTRRTAIARELTRVSVNSGAAAEELAPAEELALVPEEELVLVPEEELVLVPGEEPVAAQELAHAEELVPAQELQPAVELRWNFLAGTLGEL